MSRRAFWLRCPAASTVRSPPRCLCEQGYDVVGVAMRLAPDAPASPVEASRHLLLA